MNGDAELFYSGKIKDVSADVWHVGIAYKGSAVLLNPWL